mmetsp:Transcript_37716/g.74195  ORF Transcript_37716/g.74195 Transcript_37716/m.74195 type:complete len:405 (-) Transcript_37716:232-1446(-)
MLLWFLGTVLAVFAGAYFMFFRGSSPDHVEEAVEPVKPKVPIPKKKPKVDITANKGTAKTKAPKRGSASEQLTCSSDLIIATARGHAKPVRDIAFSACGRLLASVSEDRTVKVWKVTPNTPKLVYSQLLLSLDYATACAFSADSKYLVVALDDAKQLKFFGLKEKKGDDKVELVEKFEFKTDHTSPISSVAFGPQNKWIVTVCDGADTRVQFWSPKGTCLHTMDTKQIKNRSAVLSHDGRFLAILTKMAEVRICEISQSKDSGDLQKVEVAMTLKKHPNTTCASFSHPGFGGTDGIATGNVQGQLRYYDLAVQHHIGEEPKLLHETAPTEVGITAVAVAPGQSNVVAVARGTTLQFCHKVTGQVLQEVAVAHKDSISKLVWNSKGDQLASFGNDKAVLVWRTPK